MRPIPIRFVLIDTSHPGNIGAVARAMKNMCLEDLVLVNPRLFPDPEATARASGADDVLARARVTATLAEALEGCAFVMATTARERDQVFSVYEAREAAVRLVDAARQGGEGAAAAVIFGTERFGLTNEQLQSAHALLRIPANPDYESLNLAMAAQLIGYETSEPGAIGEAGAFVGGWLEARGIDVVRDEVRGLPVIKAEVGK